MDPSSFYGLAGIPLVTALVELCKRTDGELEPEVLPLLAVVFGVAVNLAVGASLGTSWVDAVLVGVVTGLAASGLYDHAAMAGGK